MSQEMEKGREGNSRRIINSEQLFAGSSEVVIQHKNDFYRLLVTKAGKLILNK